MQKNALASRQAIWACDKVMEAGCPCRSIGMAWKDGEQGGHFLIGVYQVEMLLPVTSLHTFLTCWGSFKANAAIFGKSASK